MSTRTDVLELLKRSEDPLRPTEVATRLGRNYEAVKKCMQRLAKAGELVNDGTGTYTVPVRDIATEPRDNRPRIRTTERESWANPPRPPRFIERHTYD